MASKKMVGPPSPRELAALKMGAMSPGAPVDLSGLSPQEQDELPQLARRPDVAAQMAPAAPQSPADMGAAVAKALPVEHASTLKSLIEKSSGVKNPSPDDVDQASQNLSVLQSAAAQARSPAESSAAVAAKSDELRQKLSQVPQDQMSTSDKLTMGLLAILPSVIGVAVAGDKGGVVGADVGANYIKGLNADVQSQRANERKNLEGQAEDLNKRSISAAQNETQAGIEKNREASAQAIARLQQEGEESRADEANATHLEGARITAGSRQTDKSLTSTSQMLESARGAPDVAQAEKDIYAAQKAQSLATMYGDPNKLSTSQVQLLASEIGKIASGGVSTHAELQGITPNTLTGSMSSVASRLLNKPTPANAAAFVKQYQDYSKAVTRDAQKVLTDKYGRILNSRRRQLGEDNYNDLKSQYMDRFSNSSDSSAPAMQGAQGQHAAGDVVSVQGKLYRVGADGDTLEDVK